MEDEDGVGRIKITREDFTAISNYIKWAGIREFRIGLDEHLKSWHFVHLDVLNDR